MLYLDNAATTMIHPSVLSSMMPYLTELYGNPSSKYYALATDSNNAINISRNNVARLIGCKSEEIIFTSGATESNNFVIKGMVSSLKDKGNHLITSKIEHPSVLEVFKYLENNGFKVTYLDVDSTGIISIDDFKEAINENTIFTSIQWANNEIGSINPIVDIAKICYEKNLFFHSDATQVIGKLKFNLADIPGLKAISISAHKFFGPKGVGALYLQKDTYGFFPPITPLLHGGGHEYGLRSGTLAVHNIVGMGKACEICNDLLDENILKLKELELYLKEILKGKFEDNIKFNITHSDKLPGILSIQFIGLNNEILVKRLSSIIALSTGSACSSSKPSYVLSSIGLNLDEIRQTIRVSLSPYTNKQDLDIFKEL